MHRRLVGIVVVLAAVVGAQVAGHALRQRPARGPKTSTSTTITTTCDAKGNCRTATSGVKGPTDFRCVSASSADPKNYPATCAVTCVANCGGGVLRQGQSGTTSGAGTVTLTCGGQVPLACSIALQDAR